MEVDYFWAKFSMGRKIMPCVWVRVKYGAAWQIVPAGLINMLRDKSAKRSGRVMRAMLEVNNLDIRKLKRAFDLK